MSLQENVLQVELVEKEIVKVEIIEKEIVIVEFSTIEIITRTAGSLDGVIVTNPQNDDILLYRDGVFINLPVEFIIENFGIFNETPVAISPLPSKRFSTAYAYKSGTLQVFLNGMKIHDSEIIKISDTQFEYPIDVILTDTIEVSYVKK